MATKYNIRLQHLFCYVSEEVSEDEVFLRFQGKKIWPENKRYGQIKRGEKVELNVVIPNIPEGETITIEIWDWDLFSANDHLGNYNLKADGNGGPYLVDMKPKVEKDTAKYSLQWSVSEMD